MYIIYYHYCFNITLSWNCRAFRRLLFFEASPSSTPSTTTPSTSPSSIPLPPFTASALFSQSFAAALRPSTLLFFVMSGAPSLLPLPWEGESEESFFQSFFKVHSSIEGEGYEKPWKKNDMEMKLWKKVQHGLDIFLQRLSVSEEKSRVTMRMWYELIQEIGSHYFG